MLCYKRLPKPCYEFSVRTFGLMPHRENDFSVDAIVVGNLQSLFCRRDVAIEAICIVEFEKDAGLSTRRQRPFQHAHAPVILAGEIRDAIHLPQSQRLNCPEPCRQIEVRVFAVFGIYKRRILVQRALVPIMEKIIALRAILQLALRKDRRPTSRGAFGDWGRGGGQDPTASAWAP